MARCGSRANLSWPKSCRPQTGNVAGPSSPTTFGGRSAGRALARVSGGKVSSPAQAPALAPESGRRRLKAHPLIRKEGRRNSRQTCGKAAENGGLLTLFSASFPHPVQGVSPAGLNALAAAPGRQVYRHLALALTPCRASPPVPKTGRWSNSKDVASSQLSFIRKFDSHLAC